MLTRKVKRKGGMIYVALPSTFTKVFNIHENDLLNVEILDNTTISIQKQ